MSFRRRRRTDPSALMARDVPVGAARKEELERAIPMGVEIAGQWAWRLLAVVGVLVVFGLLVIELKEIIIPVMVAMLVSALLVPFVQFLHRHHWPKGLAVAVAMLLTLAVVGGLIFLVVVQVRVGLPNLEKRIGESYNSFLDFLRTSSLGISEADFNSYIQDGIKALQKDSGALVSGALSVGTTAGHLLTGLLLVIFTTLFILIDGKGIWTWLVRLFPRRARIAINGAGHAGWLTLTTFVKVQIFVAFVDAVGISVGAWIIGFFIGGFPLVIPIAVLVFLASFIPVVGAVVSGVVACFIALIFGGPIPALAMLGVVLLVQEVEGHVLQPLVMGTAVKVHPLAVVLSVAGASFLAGIPGALFAVPLVAMANVMVKYVASGTWRTNPNPDLSVIVKRTDVVEEE